MTSSFATPDPADDVLDRVAWRGAGEPGEQVLVSRARIEVEDVPGEGVATLDGRPGPDRDRLFAGLCAVLGRDDLPADPRFADNAARVEHRSELVAIIGGVVRTRPVEHWVEECWRAGVPAAPVRDLAAFFSAPETAPLIEEITDPVRGALRLVAARSSASIREPP